MQVGTQIVLTGIHSLDDAYTQITEQAQLSADFGRNLDALYDVLTGDLIGPVRIIWHDYAQSKHNMPANQFNNLTAVFNDAANERTDIEILLR
jgi:ribonuclease inhibitor